MLAIETINFYAGNLLIFISSYLFDILYTENV